MNLVSSILTKNPCYTAGKKITVKGLMLHSVGCPQPNAQTFIKNWNNASYKNACVHAFIDGNDGTVYQTLPWNHRGWHCGSGKSGSANNTHIGVEMCEPACIKYVSGSTFTCSDTKTAKEVAERTYNSAVELFAYLCKTYNLNPTADGVIISHNEGNARGIASAHGDPEHLWKQLGLSHTMNGFRSDVKKAMSSSTTSVSESNKTTSTSTTTTTASIDTSTYKVQITIDNLSIRTGPGTGYSKTGKFTGKGVFSIVETRTGTGSKAGWGKLKSGSGWISLDYAKKLS
jgi:hypothetical protein